MLFLPSEFMEEGFKKLHVFQDTFRAKMTTLSGKLYSFLAFDLDLSGLVAYVYVNCEDTSHITTLMFSFEFQS